MGGTREGGLKAAETNKAKHGVNFYKSIGRIGGEISRGGGFKVGSIEAQEAGRRGGHASRRGSDNSFACLHCMSMFKTSSSLNTHIGRKHRPKPPEMLTELPKPVDVTMPKLAKAHPWRNRVMGIIRGFR